MTSRRSTRGTKPQRTKRPTTARETPPERTALLVEAKKLRAKKRFSQNFLIDESVIQKIVSALHLQCGDTIVEIGPGAGFLTQALVKDPAQVVGIELENSMCRYLKGKFKTADNFTLYEQDVLKFSFDEIKPKKFKIVGNLPYNITSPILFYLVGEIHQAEHALRKRAQQITLMVQKEVAERITAEPGTKGYNHLSIAVQFWCEARYEFTVPPNAFYPRPKVESAVITLTPREAPLCKVEDPEFFARFIQGVFRYRRKTLKNALQQSGFLAGFAAEDISGTILESLGIAPQARAETLSIQQFVELAHAVRQHTRQG